MGGNRNERRAHGASIPPAPVRRRPLRARDERGASAVELALVTPLLFLILFGILEFGVAFLHVQSIRTGVREGGRAAAVGAPVATTQQQTVDASTGSIPSDQQGNVEVVYDSGSQCNAQNIGDDVTVSYDTANLPEGGVIVRIPLIPEFTLTPVLSATFRCEV